ncbi:unnamed protein product [Dicrocoelium dendriticum]|nr:unnamed protein product [Dicrocoelium dendriticum]
MMGYQPRGVPILNSERRSTLPILLSNFNCTGRLKLSSTNLSTATVHLGVCSFTDDIPPDCIKEQRQTAVLCLGAKIEETTSSGPPNFATIAPVDCSNPTNPIIRLVGGNDRAGLVEIQHPQSGEWGTICADGADINTARTLCRMLCTSADNLKYAYPVLYSYGQVPDSVPIHLARITCPADAADVNECDLGGGWGAVGSCVHAMDLGLQCGPPDPALPQSPYKPELTCNHTHATVRYNLTLNPDLNSSMVKLVGEVPSNCQFKVDEFSTYLEAIIPLEGCGGSLSMSNESNMAIKLHLVRERFAPLNGIITSLPVQFNVTCLIPRNRQIHSVPLMSPHMVSNLVGGSQEMQASLKLYRDTSFSIALPKEHTVRPGEKVFALVTLSNPQPSTKLVLQDCWATRTPDPQSTPRQDLIINRCKAYADLEVHPISRTAVGFSFSAFYLGTAGSLVPLSTNLSLHCDTRVCHTSETTRYCQQFCGSSSHAATTKFIQRLRRSIGSRRTISSMTHSPADPPIMVSEGSIQIQHF